MTVREKKIDIILSIITFLLYGIVFSLIAYSGYQYNKHWVNFLVSLVVPLYLLYKDLKPHLK